MVLHPFPPIPKGPPPCPNKVVPPGPQHITHIPNSWGRFLARIRTSWLYNGSRAAHLGPASLVSHRESSSNTHRPRAACSHWAPRRPWAKLSPPASRSLFQIVGELRRRPHLPAQGSRWWVPAVPWRTSAGGLLPSLEDAMRGRSARRARPAAWGADAEGCRPSSHAPGWQPLQDPLTRSTPRAGRKWTRWTAGWRRAPSSAATTC